MLIEELAKEIHDNAVKHGWWDEERSFEEIIALIHSEWSEALEEARAGRPHVWYRCGHLSCDKICDYGNGGCELHGTEECQRLRFGKPEGVAVEMIDGCIRILDAFGRWGVSFDDRGTGEKSTLESLWGEASVGDDLPDKLPLVITILHTWTSKAILTENQEETCLLGAMSTALTWVHRQGYDPLRLLLDKHEYNKGRPYKHGKLF